MHAVIFAAAVGAASGAFIHLADGGDLAVKFSAFVQLHGRSYAKDSHEYEMRLGNFQTRQAAVDAYNMQAGRTWTAGVNHLADRTPEELAALRGYRHMSKGSSSASMLGLASVSTRAVNASSLPTNFTWKGQLKAMSNVVSQGGCGSCWAVSSATALGAHAELYHGDRTFSAQQITECTPNPDACGGTGGCQGATAELAMDYVARYGDVTAEELKYTGMDTACPSKAKPSGKSFLKRAEEVSSLTEVSLTQNGGAAFGMTGWRRLPENKAEPLLLALYEEGPVVVSVAANDQWSMYSSGILNACDKENAVINHAVVAVGFGQDGNNKFWQIQNSWGKSWGEDGFLRLVRLDNREEDAYCGWDMSPQDGTACKGGPEKVYVCGQCGVLYDSVVPKFTLSEGGLKAKKLHV